MWLIARRSFAEGWVRLIATMLAAAFAIGLIAGSIQFAMRAQAAVSGSDASEYARADVLVQGGQAEPDDLYAPPSGRVRPERVAGRPGVAAATGDAMVEAAVSGPDGKPILAPAGGRTLLRPWVDDARLSPYTLVSGRAPAAAGEVAVVRHVARAGGLRTGSDLTMALPRSTVRAKIVGVVTVQGRDAVAAGDLVLAPPAAVRAAAGLPAGTWQSVWVKAAPGTSAARLRADLARDLGGEVTVRTAASLRNAQASEMRTVGVSVGGAIGMLASVAVFVGLFVVANTFGTLVRQRTRRLALLGAIGATPRQIKRLIRFEALVLGAVGAVAGVAVGYPVSALLTRLFAADGFDISAADAQFGWIPLAVPAAAGIAVTQLAAWRAARQAARVSPMEAIRSSSAESAKRRWPRLLGALAVFGCAWMFFGPAFAIGNEEPPGPERTIGLAAVLTIGAMVTVAALAVLAPFFVGPLGGLVGRAGMLLSGEAGRLARATITRSPRRVSAAASSLMLGVALAAATALIMLSVQDRFDEAGRQVMKADRAVAAAENVPLPRDVAGRAGAVPGVERAAALTQTPVNLVSPRPRIYGSEDTTPVSFTVSGIDQAALPHVLDLGGRLRALGPGEIGLSSGVMETARVRPGQKIVVRGAQGRAELTVAGAYHDPSHLFADQALVAPATMDRLDPAAPAQAVLVKGGDRAALAAAVADLPGVRILDRPAYVDLAAGAYTSGLTVVYGFIGMSLLLSLFGMATTVSMSVGERTKEFGLLGAVGATVAQIRAIVRWEAATVVLLGTLLGLGTAIGTVALIQAATGSSFLDPVPPWWLPIAIAAGAAAVTLATTAFPARRASDVPVLEAAKAE
ncbi:FtsX-like permease family protein [Actinomadura sp. 21ATH]|uniref:FtsX-like permease family protein n=1 Tax=Actinomadura sp. 21ATH TaxID=1735444 RepID=UPI0035C16CC2